MLPVLLAAGVIKLVLQPTLAWVPAEFLGIAADAQRVLIIEAGMPTATLAVVFADRYGCDSAMASVVLCLTTIVSPLSLLALRSML